MSTLVFDQVVAKHLSAIFDPFHCDCRQVFGTVKQHSLQLDKGNQLLLIFLDLSAAYDRATMILWWIDCMQSLVGIKKDSPLLISLISCCQETKHFHRKGRTS